MGLFSSRKSKFSHYTHSTKEGVTAVGSTRKKVGYRSAMALAFFVAPFSVAALQGSGTNNSVSETEKSNSSLQIEVHTTDPAPLPEVNDGGNTSDDSSTSNFSTELTVNGLSIPVPENGTLSQTIPVPDTGSDASNQSSIKVDVDNHSSSSSDDTGGSSRIRVRSSTNTDVRIRSSTSSE